MKGLAAKAAAGVLLCGLATGAALGETTVPAPAPAEGSTVSETELRIIELKVLVEQVKLEAAKAMKSAGSQAEKDQIKAVIQTLDDIYAKLEDMLVND
jgi:hypothetical protein